MSGEPMRWRKQRDRDELYALLWRIVDATREELDAPFDGRNHDLRVAWAEGYTAACDRIRSIALKEDVA